MTAQPTPQRRRVDYALRRRAVLANVTAGTVALAEVCDADEYLLRAAQFHGQSSDRPCPICRKESLTVVRWIFGESLGPANGSARSESEIATLAETKAEFSVHVVEVCRSCRWNHLTQSYQVGLPPRPTTRRRARA